MNFLNNIKTGVKLIVSFLIIAAVIVVVAVFGYFNMKTINDGMTAMYFDRTLPIQQLGIANTEESNLDIYINGMLVFPENVTTYEQNISASIVNLDKEVAAYRASQLVQAEVDGLARFDPEWASLQKDMIEIVAEVKAGNIEGAKKLIGDGTAYRTAYKAVETELYNLLDINVKGAEEINTQGDVTFASAVTTIVVATIIGVLLAIVLGYLIMRNITVPLTLLVKIARALGVGDLVRDLDDKTKDSVRLRKDEFGDIGKAFDALINYLQEMGAAAGTIASNDLTVNVKANSEKDELGNAFTRMIASLRVAVGKEIGRAHV